MSWMKRLGLGVAVIAFADGCLHSRLEENWGKSYEAQATLQTQDRDAPTTTEPMESLGPETGRGVAERYYRGQEKQREREARTVMIGEM